MKKSQHVMSQPLLESKPLNRIIMPVSNPNQDIG